MRIIPYLLYLLLVAFHEVIFRDLTAIYGVTINLPAFLILAVALYKPELTVVWFGFAVGLVTSAGVPSVVGWFGLLGAAVGAVAFHVRERLNLESLASKLLLMSLGILLYSILETTISRPDGFWYILGTQVLPGTVYTTVMAWVFFLFCEGRLTAKKIRAMF